MVRVTSDLVINPAFVSFMSWDRRHYVNGPGDTVLLITMADGTVHRVQHQPHLLGGTDAYAAERAIVCAFDAATRVV